MIKLLKNIKKTQKNMQRKIEKQFLLKSVNTTTKTAKEF